MLKPPVSLSACHDELRGMQAKFHYMGSAAEKKAARMPHYIKEMMDAANEADTPLARKAIRDDAWSVFRNHLREKRDQQKVEQIITGKALARIVVLKSIQGITTNHMQRNRNG